MCAVSTEPAVESHIEVKARGGIDLRDYADYLRHQPPGCRPQEGGNPATLCLGFTVEDTYRPVAARVRQRAPNVVHIGIVAKGVAATVVAEQVRRILSLDADGDGFAALARRDPVLARLRSLRPGLRPVHFHSPYEAAFSRSCATGCASHRRRRSCDASPNGTVNGSRSAGAR
ncbi:DNA glycosylase family protein [Saccharomonospora marina]|uniref:hypothetical protein n=1 Tax=Saccharomonospora marina TaxID=632569 RepID=UPI0002DB71C4|nr:hypothetical protein [Saccharomonospora marina]